MNNFDKMCPKMKVIKITWRYKFAFFSSSIPIEWDGGLGTIVRHEYEMIHVHLVFIIEEGRIQCFCVYV